MKLVQILANKHFKPVVFRDGFNVVMAHIVNRSDKKDTHNLGKTSLIHVIDFVLLGSLDWKKDKLFRHRVFDGVEFMGEIALNDGRRVMIRRDMDRPTKIGFHLPIAGIPGLPTEVTGEETWEVLPFERARAELHALLGFDVVQGYGFRKSITYFLRTQQDYRDVYSLGKFQIGKHIDWKPFVFELLGSDGSLVLQKLEDEELISEKKKEIEVLQKEANVKVKDRDRILGLLDVRRQELSGLEATIDRFNFFDQDQALQQDLVERLDAKLQGLNSDRYRIGHEIAKTEESLRQVHDEIGLRELREIYEETAMHFPDSLQQQFENLVAFNSAISTERQKYLSENLKTLQEELQHCNSRIAELEAEKAQVLSYLTERDSYAKFKGYQKQLAKLAAHIERLEDKLRAIDKTAEIEAEIQELQAGIKKRVQAINEEIAQRHHAEINKTFNSIVQDVLGTNALISIQQNKQGNVEFDADYLNPKELVATSEAQGTTYKKILCMAFDLSLLIHYSSRSFFRFVYHDGILEGLDDRIKLRLLAKVKSVCREHGLQYILTLIDSDLPLLPDGSRYSFEPGEVCLELSDRDDSGRLFLHSF